MQSLTTDLWRFIQDTENQKHYQEWLEDPFTQLILNSVKAECEPLNIPTDRIDHGASTYVHGIHVGQFDFFKRITKLLDRIDTPESTGNIDQIKSHLSEMAPGIEFTEDEIVDLMAKIAKGEL